MISPACLTATPTPELCVERNEIVDLILTTTTRCVYGCASKEKEGLQAVQEPRKADTNATLTASDLAQTLYRHHIYYW